MFTCWRRKRFTKAAEPVIYSGLREIDVANLVISGGDNKVKGLSMARVIGPLIYILLLSAAIPAFASGASDHLTELQTGWRMTPANRVSDAAPVVSVPFYDASSWYSIPKMPSTVFQVLEDNGVYKNLYDGMNLETEVPHGLWKQDWWYRTNFTVPPGSEVYSLIFKGINYRADVWVNGHEVANRTQVAGMYASHELDISRYVKMGPDNTLAVRVIPERALPGINGVELADSWLDWINWKYIGYQGPGNNHGLSFVPDRNAGIWKRVYLSSTGKVAIRNPYVASDLPLPATSPASLTVYCDLHNSSAGPITGILSGNISRPGKPGICLEKTVTLPPNSTREVTLAPSAYPQLLVNNPDLWWPYTWGKPNLYHLHLSFQIDGRESDAKGIDFGIRKIQQFRDSDHQFPKVGQGGNFYLKVNGKNFLIRGGVYTPDLLFKRDENRDREIMSYVKDLGLNMIRWEAKIADDDMFNLADHEGVPVMVGWMCCMQWEKWPQWSAEDQWVARQSLKTQIRDLRSHASAFIWANGSDGLPPDPVLKAYHRIEKDLHWQNAIVDTVSSFKKDSEGAALWSGIHMEGPYSWRPPYYWFSGQFRAPRGSCAEQGDNEVVPPFESLKKFIPADKLWPINDVWYFHAGANNGNNTLSTIREVVDKRYGPSKSAEEFAQKAQLAYYEETRAQFEDFAASGWSNHKMTIYWMLNSNWPSFFGHLIDYYLNPGGGYFGAKKGLRPMNIVYDYYATGDRTKAKVYVVNQTLKPRNGLRVSVKFYNLDGSVKFTNEVPDFSIGPNTSAQAMTFGRVGGLSSTYFVRCQLSDASGAVLADNLYWQSTTDDDMGDPAHDTAFRLTQKSWADYSALNTMPRAFVTLSGNESVNGQDSLVKFTIANHSKNVAFFMRAEVTKGLDGEEVLPVTYNDNYITLFAGESRTLTARFDTSSLAGQKPFLRLEGYNVNKETTALTVQ